MLQFDTIKLRTTKNFGFEILLPLIRYIPIFDFSDYSKVADS